MKTIGLIGGMSWESSAVYYRVINEEVKKYLGGLHSSKCLLASVDFAEIEAYQMKGNWNLAGQLLGQTAEKLQAAGADFIVICTNTMHKVVPMIEQYITIPILHIADATADTILQEGYEKIGLLGTKFTMEQDFYKDCLIGKGIQPIIPTETERNEVHRIIYEELCLGMIKDASRDFYLSVIENLQKQGAQGIILGCTEIGLLITTQHTNLPLFDTTLIHAQMAALESVESIHTSKLKR